MPELNPQQFAMQFEPALAFDIPVDSWDEAADFIDQESELEGYDMEGLTSSIREEGIREPVRVTDFDAGSAVVDGHHRVVAAMRTGRPIPYRKFGG